MAVFSPSWRYVSGAPARSTSWRRLCEIRFWSESSLIYFHLDLLADPECVGERRLDRRFAEGPSPRRYVTVSGQKGPRTEPAPWLCAGSRPVRRKCPLLCGLRLSSPFEMSVLPRPHSRTFSAISPDQLSLGAAIAAFLSDRDLAASTRHVYGTTLRALARDVGEELPLASVTTAVLRDHMAARYPKQSPRTYNRVLASLGSLFDHAIRHGWITASPATTLERRKERLSRDVIQKTRAIREDELRAFLTRPHPLRERTLWWLLYESAARTNEVLSLDVEHLDLPSRRGMVIGKGGSAEEIAWQTTTARLLPRLIGSRRRGPLFLADIAPAPARQPAEADRSPESGHARLSYRRAAELFTEASGGWTLHQLRHSRLTHLAEHGVDVTLLPAISRHRSLRTLERYARPSLDAAAAAAARVDPAARARRP